MIDAAKAMIPPEQENGPNPSPAVIKQMEKREEIIKEATSLLKRLADRGFPDAQYFLADCYANGIGTARGKQDFDRAFPLFILAAKHGHPDACYRAGTCCEHGWGCRRDSGKAVSFYKCVVSAVILTCSADDLAGKLRSVFTLVQCTDLVLLNSMAPLDSPVAQRKVSNGSSDRPNTPLKNSLTPFMNSPFCMKEGLKMLFS